MIREWWSDILHFQPYEFDDPTQPMSGNAHMQESFIRLLDQAREIAQTPFVITSGYRSPSYNREIGGARYSSHIEGLAADISCVNSQQRHKIVAALYKVGFTRIGIGKTFIHCDNDNAKPDSCWHYYKPTGLKALFYTRKVDI